MDDFERRMELARQVGRLRGVIISSLDLYGDTIPSAVCRNLRRVLDETESEPINFQGEEGEPEASEIPVEHNGSPQVEVFEEEDNSEGFKALGKGPYFF